GRIPIPEINRPGVFARSLDHPGRFGRQCLQQRPGMFVAAMLAPHGSEHSQLDFARFASEKLTDTRVLVVAQRDFAPLSFCDRQVRYSSFWLCLKSNGGNGACRSPL